MSLTQWVRVRSPVGSVSWLRFFLGVSSTVRQMPGNVGYIRPRVSFGHHYNLKTIFIRLRATTVPDRTSPSLNKLIINQKRGGTVVQAVRPLLPPLDSRVRVSITSCRISVNETDLARFPSGFLPFSPATNFIPPFLHIHLIHFVSFHLPL